MIKRIQDRLSELDHRVMNFGLFVLFRKNPVALLVCWLLWFALAWSVDVARAIVDRVASYGV